MKVVIFGSNGFLGKQLVAYFINQNSELHLVTREKQVVDRCFTHVWDGQNLDSWSSCLENSDVVINLCGKSVNCRYTNSNKSKILDSRINSTKIIGKAIQKCKCPPKIWLNSSSATIYRHAEDRPQDEPTGDLGNDFSPYVCKCWEKALFETPTRNTRKYALRIGIVLGSEGGILPELIKLTNWGFGGTHGSGNQMFSWISSEDFLGAINYIITKKLPEGTYNVCSPKPVSNQLLMKTLRMVLNVSYGLNLPNWLIHLGALLKNTEAELVIKSRWVYPKKLLDAGFKFEYADIKDALYKITKT